MPCPKLQQVLPEGGEWRHLLLMAGREGLLRSAQEGEGRQLLELVSEENGSLLSTTLQRGRIPSARSTEPSPPFRAR
jgi:hypothetical protein